MCQHTKDLHDSLKQELILFVCFFETGFLSVTLADLELTVDQAGLKLTDPSASAKTKGVAQYQSTYRSPSSSHPQI